MESQENPSHALDMVTVFRSAGSGAEMEALEVQGLLESNGIATLLIGDARLPNLPDEVRVPKEDFERAKALIEAAKEAGPAGAEEAEASGEAGL